MPPIAPRMRLERLLPLPERDHVERHVAERELRRERRERHRTRTAVERRGAERARGRSAQTRAADRELAVLA